MGDVKMLAMIGAFLGWKAVLVTLVLASFSGALIGVMLMAAQRGNMKFALPFGTFLAHRRGRRDVRRRAARRVVRGVLLDGARHSELRDHGDARRSSSSSRSCSSS